MHPGLIKHCQDLLAHAIGCLSWQRSPARIGMQPTILDPYTGYRSPVGCLLHIKRAQLALRIKLAPDDDMIVHWLFGDYASEDCRAFLRQLDECYLECYLDETNEQLIVSLQQLFSSLSLMLCEVERLAEGAPALYPSYPGPQSLAPEEGGDRNCDTIGAVPST